VINGIVYLCRLRAVQIPAHEMEGLSFMPAL
jgi:hypothetical protein